MKLRVLGCSGAEMPGCHSSAYLIDGAILIDAGAVCSVLSLQEQAAISHILVTHAHIDHIKEIPLLADNRSISREPTCFEIIGVSENIEAFRRHLFNDVLWPDFTNIPDSIYPVVRYREIIADEEFTVEDYSVTAFKVNHTVPAVGYRISSGGTTLLFSGDTGPTEHLWKAAEGVDALIVDVSFPNSLERIASASRHLTSEQLRVELSKVRHLPSRIFATHTKPQFKDTIRAELAALGIPGLEMLKEGDSFEFKPH